MNRVSRLTFELQKHDKDLCAEWFGERICMFRKGISYESYCVNGETFVFAKPIKHFIWALTDNWTVSGRPVDWGIEPLLARLKAHDLWNRDTFADELIESYEKNEKSRDRDAENSIESFMYEFRGRFQKTFNDVNTANLTKLDRRRKEDGSHKSHA